MPDNKLNYFRENTFYYTLLLYVSVLSFSEALVSIAAGILLLQTIFLTSWKHPSVKLSEYSNLLMIVSVLGIYLLGMLKTEDLSFALYEIKKVAFWAVLPVAFFLSPKLKPDHFKNVLIVFCVAVSTASIVTVVRLIFKDNFQINEFRDVTLITHIRYSFQVVLSLIIAIYFLISDKENFSFKTKTIIIVFLVWMIGILFILKSITGIIVFIGTALLILLLFAMSFKNIVMRGSIIMVIVLTITAPVMYVVDIWNKFYDVEELDIESIDKCTESGNPYSFDFGSKEKENGYWVKAFLCEEELRQEWNERSIMKYDSLNPEGYPNSATLIRYLTSKGFRKDSVGISRLNESDMKAIEKGIANHIFANSRFSIYPRIYETIWELDRYLETGNPNFQSFSQRIEFVKASILLIKKNFWMGIGTGNWKIKYAEAYDEMDSQLLPENQGPSHNQYINYFVKFGLLGLVYIFLILLIPVFREKHQRNFVFWMFLVAMSIANMSDANFESHMGLSFFCFFYCLFLWHSPQKFKSYPL